MAKRTTGSRPSKTLNNSVAYASEPASAPDQAADRSRPANDATRNDSMGSEPGEEEIRMRAYRRYLERGGEDGQDFDDWLEAEREIKRSR
jgi:hypothetical protein